MTIEPLDLPEDVLALLAKRAPAFHEGTLLVLPVRLHEGGTGHYADSQLNHPQRLPAFRRYEEWSDLAIDRHRSPRPTSQTRSASGLSRGGSRQTVVTSPIDS